MKFRGEQSSEMTEVLSHVSSEAQLPLANLQGITSLAKAALREGKLLPLPVISVFHPLRMSSGVLPKVGCQRQMESNRAGEQLTTPLPFPPVKVGCVSSPHHFFQPMCGSRGQSQPSAPCLAGKVGEPLCPRLPGSRGGSRIPGSAGRHMREGHLCRSCRFIITCWRTKEYAWKGKNKITTFWRGAGLHSQAMGKSQSHPVALPSPATMKKAVVWPLPPPHHHSLLILHLLLLLKQLLSMCRIR